jgi:ankyrin repeat protein
MDEPIFLEDWLPPEPPDDDENWILRVQELYTSPNPPWIAEPLMLAIEANDLKEVQALLASGLSPNLCDDAMPILSIACLRGATEIVKVLLEAGAHPNLEYYGYTPLIYAVRGGHFEIVQNLVKAGANVRDGFIESSRYDGDERKIFEYLLDFCSDEELLLYLSQEDLKSILDFELDEQPYDNNFEQSLAAEELYFLAQKTLGSI